MNTAGNVNIIEEDEHLLLLFIGSIFYHMMFVVDIHILKIYFVHYDILPA